MDAFKMIKMKFPPCTTVWKIKSHLSKKFEQLHKFQQKNFSNVDMLLWYMLWFSCCFSKTRSDRFCGEEVKLCSSFDDQIQISLASVTALTFRLDWIFPTSTVDIRKLSLSVLWRQKKNLSNRTTTLLDVKLNISQWWNEKSRMNPISIFWLDLCSHCAGETKSEIPT